MNRRDFLKVLLSMAGLGAMGRKLSTRLRGIRGTGVIELPEQELWSGIEDGHLSWLNEAQRHKEPISAPGYTSYGA